MQSLKMFVDDSVLEESESLKSDRIRWEILRDENVIGFFEANAKKRLDRS
eukprot:TRINITY_DN3139_c0_g1_i1.p2 TRINITY_DN3139_c0_g1~~TRINITY_DN3139_c0_g1_i1.p2  ORF type:complete len:50 (-),score=16.62 TRINITY_DN3139_c0_g1_i1:474-623(-)